MQLAVQTRQRFAPHLINLEFYVQGPWKPGIATMPLNLGRGSLLTCNLPLIWAWGRPTPVPAPQLGGGGGAAHVPVMGCGSPETKTSPLGGAYPAPPRPGTPRHGGWQGCGRPPNPTPFIYAPLPLYWPPVSFCRSGAGDLARRGFGRGVGKGWSHVKPPQEWVTSQHTPKTGRVMYHPLVRGKGRPTLSTKCRPAYQQAATSKKKHMNKTCFTWLGWSL